MKKKEINKKNYHRDQPLRFYDLILKAMRTIILLSIYPFNWKIENKKLLFKFCVEEHSESSVENAKGSYYKDLFNKNEGLANNLDVSKYSNVKSKEFKTKKEWNKENPCEFGPSGLLISEPLFDVLSKFVFFKKSFTYDGLIYELCENIIKIHFTEAVLYGFVFILRQEFFDKLNKDPFTYSILSKHIANLKLDIEFAFLGEKATQLEIKNILCMNFEIKREHAPVILDISIETFKDYMIEVK